MWCYTRPVFHVLSPEQAVVLGWDGGGGGWIDSDVEVTGRWSLVVQGLVYSVSFFSSVLSAMQAVTYAVLPMRSMDADLSC